MKINGQHPSINDEPISRLIFKYQELTRKFSGLFRYSPILIGNNFYHNIHLFKCEPYYGTYMDHSHKNLSGHTSP